MNLVEAIERLIAAIAALLIGDSSFPRPRAWVLALELAGARGFDVVVLQV